MYKGASQNLQRAHGIARQVATGQGFDDLMVTAANMGVTECQAELAQLAIELARANNEMAAAKAQGDEKLTAFMGKKIASICSRRSPLKARLNELKRADSHQCLGDAVREIAPPEMQREIFKCAQDLLEAQWSRLQPTPDYKR